MALTKIGATLGGSADVITVTQASHGLTLGYPVKMGSNGNYAHATADTAANAEVVGIIIATTTNTLTITLSGRITVDGCVPNVTAGTVLFLQVSAGLLAAAEPSGNTQVSKPMAVVTIANSEMIMVQQRGEVISTAGISLADDSVTNAKLANTAAYTIKGNATSSSANPTDISLASATGGYSIHDNDIVLTYDADGSALKTITRGNFLSGVGGTSVAGTTDNGVLTFVNSGSTFAAESTLTFPFNTSSHGNTNDLGTLTVTGAATFQTGNSWKTGQNPPFYFVNLDPNGGDRSHVMRIRGGANASNSNVLEVQDYGGNSVFTVDGADEVKLRENNSMPSVTKGIAKAWGNFDGDAGTPSYRTSYNMGTLDDDGAGNYGCHFSTAMEDDGYVIAGTSVGDATMIVRNVGNALAEGEAKIAVMSHNGGLVDRAFVTIVVFGEQT